MKEILKAMQTNKINICSKDNQTT